MSPEERRAELERLRAEIKRLGAISRDASLPHDDRQKAARAAFSLGARHVASIDAEAWDEFHKLMRILRGENEREQ